MAKRKRGLFQRDLGQHPPPLDEFIRDWHRTDYKSGRIRWGLLPKVSPEEVRDNARWFGRFLIVFSVGFPVLLFVFAPIYERRVSATGWGSIAIFSLAAAAFGWRLIRESRSR
jgi:hypothetical protein